MKKYIKASDGSFLSFERKAKKTFKPVTAASCYEKIQSSKNVSASAGESKVDVIVDYPDLLQRFVNSGACDKYEIADYIESFEFVKGDINCDDYSVTLYDIDSADADRIEQTVLSVLEDLQNDIG